MLPEQSVPAYRTFSTLMMGHDIETEHCISNRPLALTGTCKPECRCLAPSATSAGLDVLGHRTQDPIKDRGPVITSLAGPMFCMVLSGFDGKPITVWDALPPFMAMYYTESILLPAQLSFLPNVFITVDQSST